MISSNTPQTATGSSQPFVSVVIPCFNSGRTISECLSSLRSQTYPKDRFEIIVVDNGSTDNTADCVSLSFPEVRLLRSDERGSGHARNLGVKEARGELILSTDSDCVAEIDWISGLVDAFEKAPQNTAAIGGRIAPYSMQTEVEKFQLAWVSQPSEGRDGSFKYCATPNAAFARSALVEIGSFDGTLGFDDTDLGIRLALAGYKISQTQKAVVRHRNPATLRELYRHKAKYGAFSFYLAQKHSGILGDPMSRSKKIKLLLSTARRTAVDLFVKLPISVVSRTSSRPRTWPLMDAVTAIGNYHGFSTARAKAKEFA